MPRRVADAFTLILDAIIPPRERSVRLRTAGALCPEPQTLSLQGTHITTLIPYHAPGVEDAVRALKYDGNAKAAQLLADMLADYLQEELASMRAFSARKILLVPVPLHYKRKRERGFNQIEKVLAKLSEEFRDGTLSGIEPRALFRTRATPPQTRLHRTERLQNVRGAFSADKKLVSGATVILIDDVCTTGSTLRECATTLAHAGAKVTALALARA